MSYICKFITILYAEIIFKHEISTNLSFEIYYDYDV
jgi:hypothetical protein